jgi:hypothetical protein
MCKNLVSSRASRPLILSRYDASVNGPHPSRCYHRLSGASEKEDSRAIVRALMLNNHCPSVKCFVQLCDPSVSGSVQEDYQPLSLESSSDW